MPYNPEETDKIKKLLLSIDEGNKLLAIELLKNEDNVDDFAALLAFLLALTPPKTEFYNSLQTIFKNVSATAKTLWTAASKLLAVYETDKEKISNLLEDYEKHIHIFDDFMRNGPEYAEAYRSLGKRLMSIPKKQKKGLEYLQKAAEFNPNNYVANYDYAYHLPSTKKNADKAIVLYKQCLFLDNSFYGAFHNLGKAYAAKGDFDNAIEIYKEGLTKFPNQADMMIELSLSTKQNGNVPEARRLLELALSVSPNNDLAHNNYAFMLWNSYQEYDLALEHINKALKLSPKNAIYSHTLAEVEWYGFKNKEKALAALHKAKVVDKRYKAGDKMIEEVEKG